MKTQLRKLVDEYVKGKISRDSLIQQADPNFITKGYHEESIFHNLLEIFLKTRMIMN